MFQFRMPDIGEGTAEAEVVMWLVREGDVIVEDQIIVEVMTDKATVEIPSPRAGRVHRLCSSAGDIVEIGAVLIEIDGAEEDGNAPTTDAGMTPEILATSVGAGEPGGDSAESENAPDFPGQRSTAGSHPPNMPLRPHEQLEARRDDAATVEAVPAVRQLAKELGIPIERVRGTGPHGRVMRRDLETYRASPETMEAGGPGMRNQRQEDEADWQREPLRGVRRLTARRMAASKREIPHYTYVDEVDLTRLEQCRRAHVDGPISPLAFIAAAATRVLPDYPAMNASFDQDRGEIIYKRRIHLAVAMTTSHGLIVPVIEDADGRTATELQASIQDLAERADGKLLGPGEMKGSTFTITSLGKLGGVAATPIINYPESAILGVHAIRTLPRYVGETEIPQGETQLMPRRIVNLSISLDHRIVDGFECAQFMRDVKEVLETADFPEFRNEEG